MKQGHSASRCYFRYSKSNNYSNNSRPLQILHLLQVQENEQFSPRQHSTSSFDRSTDQQS